MIKTVALLKRRAGMSVAAFRDYYEAHHRRLGERLLAGYAVHYERRYLNPAASAPTESCAYDVLLEVWYPDAATHAAAQAQLTRPEIAAEIVADEEKLFDRPLNRFFVVDAEVASEL